MSAATETAVKTTQEEEEGAAAASAERLQQSRVNINKNAVKLLSLERGDRPLMHVLLAPHKGPKDGPAAAATAADRTCRAKDESGRQSKR